MRRLVLLALIVAACGGSTAPDAAPSSSTAAPVTTTPVTTTPETTTPETTTPVGAADCPEVLAVDFRQEEVGVFTVSATVRSIDIEGVSFADAWEVRDLAGQVLGIRILTHPHANEQPFTRSLSNVPIAREVTRVEVAARDSVRGFCGVSLTVGVPHS